MSMYVVLVTDVRLGGTTPFGPYRTRERAHEVAALFSDPFAADYRDPSEYGVVVAMLRRYGETT